MRSTRRDFLQRAGALALGASGIYGLAEGIDAAPARAAGAAGRPLPPEQHVLGDLRLVRDNGIEVVVPPLHHQVVTANLRIDRTRASLRKAKAELDVELEVAETPPEPPAAAWQPRTLRYTLSEFPSIEDVLPPLVLPSGRNHSVAGAATAVESKPARPLSK